MSLDDWYEICFVMSKSLLTCQSCSHLATFPLHIIQPPKAQTNSIIQHMWNNILSNSFATYLACIQLHRPQSLTRKLFHSISFPIMATLHLLVLFNFMPTSNVCIIGVFVVVIAQAPQKSNWAYTLRYYMTPHSKRSPMYREFLPYKELISYALPGWTLAEWFIFILLTIRWRLLVNLLNSISRSHGRIHSGVMCAMCSRWIIK